MKNKFILFLFSVISINSLAQYDEFEEISPSFYNSAIYTVDRDSSQFEIIERYIRKDNSVLNWVKKWTLDKQGNIIQFVNQDTLGKLKSLVICSAPMIKYKYDERNNLIEKSYWNGEDSRGIHECLGIHREEKEYDKKNRIILRSTYNIKEVLQSRMQLSYNRKNNVKKVVHLNKNNEVLKGESNISLIKYDAKNREVRRTYRTHENKKVEGEKKISYVTIEYAGNYQIETAYNFRDMVIKKTKIRRNKVMTITEDL